VHVRLIPTALCLLGLIALGFIANPSQLSAQKGKAKAAPKGDPLGGVKAPAGFDVTLFAAPPDVSYPTCIAASPDGVLFVGVDLNGSLGAKENKGKVVRCVDTDNDGKADEFKTFCEVESPRGLWWDNDKTLYVLHPPFITAYTDDNGDGISDRKEDILTGLGFDLKFRGADHTTNGFRYAIDGFFYIAVGDYGAIQAKGKDGRTLQLHGGGVVRIRPDGSGLELVADGLRNIYDVAVSPTLDLFTRDNTNDGGGWNVRVSHIHATGHYGYPRLFKNFNDEIIQPLADYGGGSPCGAIFLDEPGFPAEYTQALLFCEWGAGAITRHPLKANGSTFKIEADNSFRFPRPTDIDVDGSGRLYISSWKDGSFNFSTPDVGFIARMTPKDWKYKAFPDLKKMNVSQLLKELHSSSGTTRTYVQREMLRRKTDPKALEGLEKGLLAEASFEKSLPIRIAILATLKQLVGSRANGFLVNQIDDDAVREYALRLLADAPEDRSKAPTEPFVKALADTNPRVREQAAIGLARIGDKSTAKNLLPLVADADPVVTHLAINALIALKASDVCFGALDSADAKLYAGALRVLQELHEPAVVDGLLKRLKSTAEAARRKALIVAVARLYQKEAPWDGKWWSTRPDTTGPYYRLASWDESERIGTVLKGELAKADAETLTWLLPELLRHRVDLPEVMKTLIEGAKKDAGLRKVVVDVLGSRGTPPAEVLPVLAMAAADPKESGAVRAAAARGLAKVGNAREALLNVLSSEKLPAELEAVWLEFVRDGKRSGELAVFTKLAGDVSPTKKELAYGILASIADRNLGDAKVKKEAEATLAGAWAKADTAQPLLRAISRLGLTSFAPQLRKLSTGTDATLAAAAKDAAKAMKLDLNAANKPSIGTLKYDDVMAAAEKEAGNAELGAKLFGRIGCANCHTVSASEPLKGPMLAEVRKKYSRAEVLESILKPSAKITQGFESFTFVTLDGKSLIGFVVKESGTELEIRDGTGATTILKKSDLDEKKPSKLSAMPEKLVDDLTVSELASLIAYLESLNKQ
jgi:putative heme-binding domain-containing protein